MSRGGLAVVTGAAGGIGTAIARRLSAAGSPLLLVDLDPGVEESAADLRAEGADARPCVADVTGSAGRGAVTAAVRDSGTGVAALVNNAGINRDARVEAMSEEQFATVIAVNLLAPIQLTADLGGELLDGSSVINMSSRASLGNLGQVNYATSKAGLVGFTRALAQKLAPRVRVNAIAPGLIATPMTEGMPERVLSKLVARIPAGRIGTPDDVAELVAFLASPASSYVTGQLIVTCGGRSVAP
jgi:NAD(P)-dependent dehydrogenase (short-subunit alcohol dehydrogenase family)